MWFSYVNMDEGLWLRTDSDAVTNMCGWPCSGLFYPLFSCFVSSLEFINSTNYFLSRPAVPCIRQPVVMVNTGESA